MHWKLEKFFGDYAIYAFCPQCGFHYVMGDAINQEVETYYNYCPICGAYFGDSDLPEVIYNKRNIMDDDVLIDLGYKKDDLEE